MTEPKYKPILFTAPMVRAILEGRKTQTRRIVEQKHIPFLENIKTNFLSGNWGKRPLPYGKTGDRLWVRENWRIGAWDENNGRFALDYCDGPRKEWITVPESTDDYLGEGVFEHYWMQCSNELSKKGILPDSDGQYHWEHGKSPLRWRPSIHMPRWASRITLEVTGVRVEKLQDISEEDCFSEGVQRLENHSRHATGSIPLGTYSGLDEWTDKVTYWVNPRDAYKALWKSIHGPGSWEKNPWVWVVEFKRVEGK